MYTHPVPRLLLVGLLFCLIATGVVHVKAAANTGPTDWSDTVSGENEYVQFCKGFDITTSYTSKLTYHVVENHPGERVIERMNVSFVGALANAKNGQSLPFDGKFTRTTYHHIGRVMIADLELRIQLPIPGDFTVNIAQQETDFVANPVDVIHAFAQREMESGICVLLGRTFAGSVPANGPTGFLDMLQGPQDQLAEAINNMTPWTELDPCGTVTPGQSC
jgi:hypothetical protein